MTILERAKIDMKDAAPMMQRASYASVAVASILIVAKLAAGLFTGSVAILSSLMDSVLDLVASVINIVAIHQAVQPADVQHRFGHGKAEAVAGLLQAAGISASALFIVFQAIERLVSIQPVVNAESGIMVMIFSTFMTGVLVLYQSRVVKKTQSLAVSADSLHYKGDLFTNMGVILALILVAYFDIHWVDPIMAVCVAAYLGWSAWAILKEALNVLMDRELPSDEREEIVTLIKQNEHVIDVHDLRTRSAGHAVYLQFHIDLQTDISLTEAHDISDDVEDMLFEHYPGAEIIIHSDPLGVMERKDDFNKDEDV